MCLVSQAYHDGMEQTDLQHLWKNKDGHTFLCYSSHQKESVSTVFESALLLSHFSHVRLCATPQTAAHQAPPSLGFSRQEHWSGLPFPSSMHESEVAQSYPTLRDPMDCGLPGSSAHGIFQARVLEWGAIAFSNYMAQKSLNIVNPVRISLQHGSFLSFIQKLILF